MRKDPRDITPAEWRARQHAPNQIPSEIRWPADTCSRCRRRGEMRMEAGGPLCAECADRTVVQTGFVAGIHERKVLPQLNA